MEKCRKCSEPASVRVTHVYLGAEGFDVEVFLCAECAEKQKASLLKDKEEGRISWMWKFEITPLRND